MEALLVSLLYVLLYVLIAVIIAWLIIWILSIPPFIARLIWAVVAVIALILIVQLLLGGLPTPRLRAAVAVSQVPIVWVCPLL